MWYTYSGRFTTIHIKMEKIILQSVVPHALKPSTGEAEAGESRSSRPAWSMSHRETILKKKKKT